MKQSQILKNILDSLINKGIVLSQFELCKKINYDNTNFTKILSGDRERITSGLRLKLSQNYGVKPEYMATGKGDIYEQNPEKSYIRNKNDESHVLELGLGEVNKANLRPFIFSTEKLNLTIVPIKAFGGFLAGYADKDYMETLERSPFPFLQGECFAFEVEGFSMMPDYVPGSWVVTTQVEKFAWMQKGKEYIFVTVDGIILKRFVKIDEAEKKCHLESINKDKDYIVKPIPLKNIKKVYFIEYKINKP